MTHSASKTSDTLDVLAMVALDNAIRHEELLKLISTGERSVCSRLRMSSASADDLRFIAEIPRFGLGQTIYIAKAFGWNCGQVASALVQYAFGVVPSENRVRTAQPQPASAE